MVAADLVERGAHIVDAAREDADVFDVAHRARREDRDQCMARLEADDAAEGRRPAHRTARIGAEGKWTQSCRHRGGAAGAAAAGRAARVVRVAHHLGRIARGVAAPGEFPGARLAEDDRAGSAQALHEQAILVGWRRFRTGCRTVAGGHAGNVEHVLDRERNTVERTELASVPPASAGGLRGRPGRVVIDVGEGIAIDLRIVDARQQVLADLHGIELPPPVCLPQPGNIKLVYLLLHRRSTPYKQVSFIPHRY